MSTTAPIADPTGSVARATLAQRLTAVRGIGRLLVALAAALALFAILMLVKGVNPFTAYKDMVTSTFGEIGRAHV